MAEVLLSRCSSYGIGPFNLLMMLFWDHCEISFSSETVNHGAPFSATRLDHLHRAWFDSSIYI